MFAYINYLSAVYLYNKGGPGTFECRLFPRKQGGFAVWEGTGGGPSSLYTLWSPWPAGWEPFPPGLGAHREALLTFRGRMRCKMWNCSDWQTEKETFSGWSCSPTRILCEAVLWAEGSRGLRGWAWTLLYFRLSCLPPPSLRGSSGGTGGSFADSWPTVQQTTQRVELPLTDQPKQRSGLKWLQAPLKELSIQTVLPGE